MKRLLLILMAVTLLTGPAMGQKVKSFCAYGTGSALTIGAGGAVWDQAWGEKAWEWFDCGAKPNVDFINKKVVGLLETTTTAAPIIDENLVLHLPFVGGLTLTAYGNNCAGKISGQIFGRAEGEFVVDGNAAHAVVDEQAGTITITFGTDLHDSPDALIEVTATTGKFKSIHAVGPWQWYVKGTITIALVPDLPLQDNIFAALQYPSLLLGAEEEIVLTGSYYRSSEKK